MGKRGKKGGQSRGRGGNGASNAWRERSNKTDVDRHNVRYETYYNELEIVAEGERDKLWEALRRDLPNSFRFTGSKAHALAVQQRLRDFYIPQITSITYEGENVQTPQPVTWYPDQLAWYMTTPKHIIRRFPPFASFQKFLVAETDIGNISRQEVVSMIPPLCMDIEPGMTVLDLCAAPGSKSAQLLEMVHGGEEERSRTVAEHLANGLDRPTGEGYDDDGRSTGLLIANDIDYKRAHMLVHQMKRLSSPNIIVTNHDATIYPSIRLPSAPFADRRSPKRYLKFDRILADVPCSGDGTCRKNLEIWRNWNPGNALGLHPTQVRILIRALQMLKVGGRVVYSTCSMNPIEDEAVLAAAIERCGGADNVEIVDSSSYLPGLRRYAGMRTWKVMDKQGRRWTSYEEVSRQREQTGVDGLGRIQKSMFPPLAEVHLERCMRVYPHLQDTGAFFIAILEKKTEIKAKAEEKPKLVKGVPEEIATLPADDEGQKLQIDGTDLVQGSVEDDELSATDPQEVCSPTKRARDDDADPESSASKRSKSGKAIEKDFTFPEAGENLAGDQITDVLDKLEETLLASIDQDAAQAASTGETQLAVNATTDDAHGPSEYKVKKGGQPFEEPFKYLAPDLDELERIREFYNISPRFPPDRFMVRNEMGTATKNIYYTTALAKSILQENEGKGIKFIHSGVKMFVKQNVPNPDVCPWRIQTDGLTIVEPWIGPQRRIKLWRRKTLHKLLVEMFPRFNGDEWKSLGEIGPQIMGVSMGCCALEVQPSEDEEGLSERMAFPLWKSLHSLNLMLPKEDRKALLLRLYNDDTPLVNMSHRNAKETMETKETALNFTTEMAQPRVEGEEAHERRNSSSQDEADGGGGLTANGEPGDQKS